MDHGPGQEPRALLATHRRGGDRRRTRLGAQALGHLRSSLWPRAPLRRDAAGLRRLPGEGARPLGGSHDRAQRGPGQAPGIHPRLRAQLHPAWRPRGARPGEDPGALPPPARRRVSVGARRARLPRAFGVRGSRDRAALHRLRLSALRSRRPALRSRPVGARSPDLDRPRGDPAPDHRPVPTTKARTAGSRQ